jgi:hypothetical protein
LGGVPRLSQSLNDRPGLNTKYATVLFRLGEFGSDRWQIRSITLDGKREVNPLVLTTASIDETFNGAEVITGETARESIVEYVDDF